MKHTWNERFGIDPDVIIPDEDRKVELKLYGMPGAVPPVWMQIVAFLPMLMVFLAGVLAIKSIGLPGWTMAGAILAAIACLIFGNRWILRHHYGRFVRRELRLRGYDICVHCGYSLRGLAAGARCPECGAASKPRSDLK